MDPNSKPPRLPLASAQKTNSASNVVGLSALVLGAPRPAAYRSAVNREEERRREMKSTKGLTWLFCIAICILLTGQVSAKDGQRVHIEFRDGTSLSAKLDTNYFDFVTLLWSFYIGPDTS